MFMSPRTAILEMGFAFLYFSENLRSNVCWGKLEVTEKKVPQKLGRHFLRKYHWVSSQHKSSLSGSFHHHLVAFFLLLLPSGPPEYDAWQRAVFCSQGQGHRWETRSGGQCGRPGLLWWLQDLIFPLGFWVCRAVTLHCYIHLDKGFFF